uniref:Tubulin polyglutamylase complex subunit 1-like n=1 Tax=Phallusia mammillata TaxID=59560 RepID=A0A6F9D8I3_9ASCI|nr:tubulin polyglutamylase complex subunit 1-like [Phallusia mammillata]
MGDRKKSPIEERKQQYKDYLDKTDVTSQVREALLKLIENQPKDPMLFLANYFDNISTSDKSDKITTVHQILQLTHHSQQSFQTNLIVAYDAASLAKNPNSKKASMNRPGLTGSVFEELLATILSNVPKNLHATLLERIGCRASEMVPFGVFRYCITVCYVFVDFVKLCGSIFSVLCGKQSGKVTDKDICEIVISSLKDALDSLQDDNSPCSILEAAYVLRPDKLASSLLSNKSSKTDKSTMNEDDFMKEMIDVFTSKIKVLK